MSAQVTGRLVDGVLRFWPLLLVVVALLVAVAGNADASYVLGAFAVLGALLWEPMWGD